MRRAWQSMIAKGSCTGSVNEYVQRSGESRWTVIWPRLSRTSTLAMASGNLRLGRRRKVEILPRKFRRDAAQLALVGGLPDLGYADDHSSISVGSSPERNFAAGRRWLDRVDDQMMNNATDSIRIAIDSRQVVRDGAVNRHLPAGRPMLPMRLPLLDKVRDAALSPPET